MFQAYLAEHKPYALPCARSNSQKDALERQRELEIVLTVAAQDGDCDTAQSHGHSQCGAPGELLAQQRPACKCSHRRRQSHEQLAESGPDGEIAVEQAPVAEYIPHNRRQSQPEPRFGIGINGIWMAYGDPQDQRQQECGECQPENVGRHGAYAVACFIGIDCGDSPKYRYNE